MPRKSTMTTPEFENENDDFMTDAEMGDTFDGGDGGFFMDLTDATAQPEMIPAGVKALVACTKAEAKLTKSGFPMICIVTQAEVIEEATGVSNPQRFIKRTVRDNLTMIPPQDGKGGTVWRFFQALSAFGIETERLQQKWRSRDQLMGVIAQIADELIGSVASVTYGIDTNERGMIDTATGEKYPPKNAIMRYAKPKTQAAQPHDPYSTLPF